MAAVAIPTAPEPAQGIETTSDTTKAIRITSHGKMKLWVGYSLSFFEDLQEHKKIVFHTLPASMDYQGKLVEESGKQTTSSNKMSTLSLIPRLVSVVEIIKREFMKHLDSTKSARMLGLHQYNEIGHLETQGHPVEGETEAQRSESIIQALSGKSHPKQKQTPFMRITLSLEEQPGLVDAGATYQPPSRRKVSKSAKTRAKKRAKKEAALAEKQAANESDAE
ncbi:hypothetical protein D9613_008920 [Agrocybe pediades]|uniref:Uncharacterized protein n=1 Tax=Agrocybe pediades TaxID=84607 RepID=A0A8H4QV26_9AGAR|nr:hypothetical protein D9613_008920 [Agrocybe pediades]